MSLNVKMAVMQTKLFSSIIARGNIFLPSVRHVKVTMGDPLEQATGINKRELLARLSGDNNPWDFRIIKRGPGTKDKPTEIPSAFEERIIGCICHEESASVNYMLLYKGHPKRCECGYWFCLVHKPPV